MIVVVDFGSQTAHLIARRIADFGVDTQILQPEEAFEKIENIKPGGIVFSGGPLSVYEKNAPHIDRNIFDLGIPILAICYGMQLTAYLLGGDVKLGKKREDGPATLTINASSLVFDSLSPHSRVWMSHGDEVLSPPVGFSFLGETETVKGAAMSNEKKKIYCVLFHPEVDHTEHGNLVLKNFVEKICGITIKKRGFDEKKIIKEIKKTVGGKKVLAAVSGGLDSTVAAALVAKAIGENLIPVHVDSGLMREGTPQRVEDFFKNHLKIRPIILYKQTEFLKALKRKIDPEEKRKAIGKLYIDLFEEEMKNHTQVGFLAQGTIYSDVIESKGSKHAENIKSHHNVGGLPDYVSLQLIEPIRNLYTDQVRELAKKLGIPNEFIVQQPHPGPGYAIRIIGEVTLERLEVIQKADAIVVEEMKKANWYEKVIHSFAILTGIKSTSVKGDGRVYGEVVALRILTSKDRMTADWAKVPYDLLQKITSRITNEIPQVSRVVYDITTKPPATMEWE